MKRKSYTRRALFLSVISMLMCVSMLVGTTFAWFTDGVTSGVNTIAAGNLDVELYHGKTAAPTEKVDSSEKLFTDFEGKLIEHWEPGVVAYTNLKVANVGTLALKYQMALNFTNANYVEHDGKQYTLADVLKVAVVKEGFTGQNRAAAHALFSDPNVEVCDLASFALNGELKADETTKTYGIVIYWEPGNNDYDNLFNLNNGKKTNDEQPLRIDLGINLFATQVEHEEDSFDKNYDKVGTAVFTVAEANELLAMNEDVTLVNCIEPNGIIYIPANYNGTLALSNVTIASVQESAPITTVAEGEETVTPTATPNNIVILGNVVIKATEEGMSAITGTMLNIAGNGHLTAVGKGVAAFGIGGMTTESITITDVTVDYVEGGEAYGVGSDTKYYKDAPEGGAAIGSGYNGAVITLDDVNIVKAIGGSKAAGIGARYHVGVTVNIENSKIGYVEGGVSAAGIGGSRISNGATESGTTINITNSTVTAKGGAYGAGIGSGYDTHCQAAQPLCTINITGSTISATGGQYAAGVGTGYHHAALAGEIKNSTVNAVSGEKWYKDAYTVAMGVGFGVVDPAREGQQTDSHIIYNGVKIAIPAPGRAVSTLAELKAALEAEVSSITLTGDIQAEEAISIDYETSIYGDGCTISRAPSYTGNVLTVKSSATLTLANVTVDGGAVWTTASSAEATNAGVTATGYLVATEGNGSVVLEAGTVLQNNDGAGAVGLATRGGGSLTVNGASILNNRAAGGAAIWGGGNITINAGSKINGNHATSIGGAIRMVDGYNKITFTMNGGEMNYNTSAGTGGAIWGGNRSTYIFNGGEMAYNSATSGGAIWTGTYETYKIGGDFSLHDNSATDLGGAIRFCDHASVTITGGEIYNNTVNGESSAFFLNNNSASITGGEISDNFSYSGGLGLTVGEANITGVIHFNLGTNHKTAYLAESFNSFSFTVEEAHVGNFNFKPAAGYTYTDGDEAKLTCMNEGYETYWDAATSTFRLQAK